MLHCYFQIKLPVIRNQKEWIEMDWELIKITIWPVLLTVIALIVDNWLVINTCKKIGYSTMYKDGPETDREFLKKMQTLCLKARDGVNRNYKSNYISLEQSMKIKAEIDELRSNLRHGPRGRLQKVGYLTRRKLGKLDSVAINSIDTMVSNLESGKNESLTSNCSLLIKETNDALTRRTHLVINTGD